MRPIPPPKLSRRCAVTRISLRDGSSQGHSPGGMLPFESAPATSSTASMPGFPVTTMWPAGMPSAQQVAPGALGGGEVQRAQLPGDHAVELFRKRLGHVACAQAGFHVRHRNPAVKGSQRARHGGGGVALDDCQRRAHFGQQRIEGRQHPRRGLRQRLPRRHQVQIVIRPHAEALQHLVEHLAVLRGGTDQRRWTARRGRHLADYRTQLDRLRPRAKNEKHRFHE